MYNLTRNKAERNETRNETTAEMEKQDRSNYEIMPHYKVNSFLSGYKNNSSKNELWGIQDRSLNK